MRFAYSALILFILILSANCFSFSSMFEWGNGEYNTASCPGYLFSSCYPQNDLSLNYTRVYVNDYPVLLPVVFSSPSDSYTDKYLYVSGLNSISIYNAKDASLLTTYSNPLYPTNSLVCKPYFMRDDLNSGYDMVTVEQGTDTSYIITRSAMLADKSFAAVSSKVLFNTSVSNIEDCSMFFPSTSGYFSLYLTNGTLMTYIINDSGIFNYDNIYLNIYNCTGGTCQYSVNKSYPFYSNYIVSQDVNSDGYDDLVYAIPSFTTDGGGNEVQSFYYGAYNLKTKTDIVSKTLFTFDTECCMSNFRGVFSSHVQTVKTGIKSSPYRIYVNMKYGSANGGGSRYNNTINYVFDLSKNTLFNVNEFWNPIGFPDRTINNSNTVFTDYDYNGITEACLFINETFSCYNSNFINIFSTASDIHTDILAMMKLDSSPYMSVLTKKGIYDISSNYSSIDNIKNFSYNNYKYVVPVSLLNKNNYSNDILASSTFFDLYEFTSQADYCGNAICSSYETPLTCPEDCAITENVTAELLSAAESCENNNQCASGLCEFGKCALKTIGDECDSNSQCLSNSCSHGKCTDAGSSAGFKQLIQNLFGFNSSDGIIFYLLIALILFLISVGASVYLTTFIPALCGLIFNVIILVGFTFIGIVPGWFLLMTLIFLMIIAFIIFMVLSRQQ